MASVGDHSSTEVSKRQKLDNGLKEKGSLVDPQEFELSQQSSSSSNLSYLDSSNVDRSQPAISSSGLKRYTQEFDESSNSSHLDSPEFETQSASRTETNPRLIEMSFLRYAMCALALLEVWSASQWVVDAAKQERELSGLLMHSGCAHSTACGADGVCAAYGRVMAWALLGLSMVRAGCAFGHGKTIWLIGIVGHLVESCFWWSEFIIASYPRLAALPSMWKRIETLLFVALKPPYSIFQIILIGPPFLALWIYLSYSEFDIYDTPQNEKEKVTKKKYL